MKILIISGYFYPEITPRAFRTTELAKELSRQGHSVTVYAPLHDSDYISITSKYTMRLENIPLNWKSLTLGENRLSNFATRAFNRLSSILVDYPTCEFVREIPKILRRERGNTYDLLISIAQPHAVHWGVNIAMKRNPSLAKIWVADCGDPYMGCKTDTFKKLFYFKYIEKSFCNRCNYIAVPIADAIPSYYPEFKDKIKVIPQGFDFSKADNPTLDNPTNEFPTFVFAGSIIPGIRDPRPLLTWFSTRHEQFRFHLFTNRKDLLAEYVDSMKGKFILHGFVPRPELLDFMKRCDFLLNLENGTSVQAPSKLIDYALCKRPILSINSNDLDTKKIEEFLYGDYHQKMDDIDISAYDIRNVAKQFLDLAK